MLSINSIILCSKNLQVIYGSFHESCIIFITSPGYRKKHVLQHSPPEGDLTSLLENSLEVVFHRPLFQYKNLVGFLRFLRGGW